MCHHSSRVGHAWSASPTVEMQAKHLANDKCNEVQAFGYHKDVHTISPIRKEDFFKLLGVPNIPLRPSNTSTVAEFAITGFIEAANAMAKSLKDECESLHLCAGFFSLML